MADISQIKLPNGSIYDIKDEVSGYITLNDLPIDQEIPVSRIGDVEIGDTVGTESTNLPTSKAVVDYVEERLEDEIGAINVPVESVNGKTGQVVLTANDVGAASQSYVDDAIDNLWIPTSTSQLTNDSGFITSESDPTVPDWAKAETKPTYTAAEVGALPSSTVIPEDKVFIATYNSTTYADTLAAYNANKLIFAVINDGTVSGNGKLILPLTRFTDRVGFQFEGQYLNGRSRRTTLTLNTSGWTIDSTWGNVVNRSATISSGDNLIIRDVDDNNVMKYSSISFGINTTQYLANDGTWQSIPAIPTNISAFTNDAGYLTSSDIASVLTYKGTKASVANLPSTGNKTGDVWHITADGSEYAWDGSIWQELGTAIDLSGYATKATTLSGYGIIDAKIQNGTITLGSNTITPLTSYTETDPVFSASAASGITATDISNWNNKIDKQYISNNEENILTIYPYCSDSGATFGISIESNDNCLSFEVSDAYISMYDVQSEVQLIKAEPYNENGSVQIRLLKDPEGDRDAANKKYVDDSIGALSIPTKTSDLTNDSGFITSYTDEKLKTGLISTNTMYYIILDTGSTTATTKYRSNTLSVQQLQNTITVQIGKSSSSVSTKGELALSSNRNALVTIGTNATDNRIITLPDASGTIALTSDIPDTSSFLTSETDPVFSASAAAGITSTDISNWNSKSDTDEKVKAVSVTNDGSTRYLVFGSNTGNAETKYYSDALRYALLENNYALFSVGDTYHPGRIHIESGNRNTGNGVNLITSATTGRTITFPDKTGTVAMTSDIPQAYSSTNTGGYLTMATLPIYDGTVV